MRTYEELFIVKPDATEEEVDSVVEQIRNVVIAQKGVIDKVEKWGVRKLAYRVQKHNDGYYVLVQFQCGPDAVKEIERRLRVSDLVLKYLTVRIDERLKWVEKRQQERAKRAAKRPAAPPAPSPVAPAEPAPPVPGAPVAKEKTKEESEKEK
jgi:small subunit ribosomal protein S6